jgi:hypothetical protein
MTENDTVRDKLRRYMQAHSLDAAQLARLMHEKLELDPVEAIDRTAIDRFLTCQTDEREIADRCAQLACRLGL